MEKRDNLPIQGDKSMFNRFLTRNSSVGFSSRISYYYRKHDEGIPFQWELQPGKAKSPPKEETIPPLIPPPALLNLGLPKPFIEHSKPNKKVIKPIRLIIKFWKKNKMDKQRNNINIVQSGLLCKKGNIESGSGKYERFEFCSSDNEFITSPCYSTSSSSSSFSFPNGLSRESSRLQNTTTTNSDSLHVPLSCSPFNISSILVSIGRRPGFK